MRLLKFVHYRSASRQEDDCVIHNGNELPEGHEEQQRAELAQGHQLQFEAGAFAHG